ncbi:hypothetical protein GGR28_001080 [Lewinella aquimaris]|uniref:HTH domain-containing protein n=1 Tax=Neolewinella aquimaris TaxID=1835722 RepID=A0A840E5M3_9BACT|nr:hypothetical protein [Neolewinella aquimaris]MBB4078467.1 hypothetical protein [Neolewinella aquimaris]
MSLSKHLDRLHKMHRLIKFQRTGTPEEFAVRLGISRSMLYRLIGELKAMDAPIYFCVRRQSYTYSESVELQLGFKRTNPAVLRDAAGGATCIPLMGKAASIHRS